MIRVEDAGYVDGVSGTTTNSAPPASLPASEAGSLSLLSKPWIYLMCAGDFGLAFVWVIKYAVTSSYVRQALGGGPFVSHVVWSLGPLSGLIAAPVVGALSDRCKSRIGRRRPYIAGGMLAALFGMAIFASARRLVGGRTGPPAVAVAVIGFAMLDFASNVIMFPSRALLGDLVPAEQQHDVQSAAAVIASVAEIVAGAYMFSWDEPVTHIERIFFIAGIMLTLSVSLSLIVCREKPLCATNAPTASPVTGVHQRKFASTSEEAVFSLFDTSRDGADFEMQVLSDGAREVGDGSIDHDDRNQAKSPGDPEFKEQIVQDFGSQEQFVDEEDTVQVFCRRPSSISNRSRSPSSNFSEYLRPNNVNSSNSSETNGSSIGAKDIEDYPGAEQISKPEQKQPEVSPSLENGLTQNLGSPSQQEASSVSNKVAPHDGDESHIVLLHDEEFGVEEELETSQNASAANRPVGQRHERLDSIASDNPISLSQEVFESVGSAIRNFPKPLSFVGTVYFLAWACWFACLPTYSLWIGEAVLNGDPTAAAGTREALLYERGVTVFALANMIKAFIALGFSAYYPSMVRFVGDVGERAVFGIPFLVFALVIWKFAYTNSEVMAIFVVAAGAVPFIATQTIPVAIAVARFPENLASNLGIMNLFCVTAQLFDTLYTGAVAKYFGEQVVMRIAGAWAIIAGIAAFLML